MNERITVALVGNFGPFWSTESEYKDAYERAGHILMPVQEGDHLALHGLLEWLKSGSKPDLVQWTRTKSLADQWGDALQWELIAACRRANVPLIGVHLDRWWGLKHPDREHQLTEDPYFKGVDLMFTADGGHQEQWADIKVNHHWLLPAISERWLGLGEWKPEYDCDVVFVGGWDNYGHRDWKHRAELIAFLSKIYGDTFLALPLRGQPRIVGRDLNDVYASAKVVVGDSCLIPKADGSPMTHYCSDRIPETLGRGGILVHPRVEGTVWEFGPTQDPPAAFDTFCWDLGDWGELRERVDHIIGTPAEHDDTTRSLTIKPIAERHTYTHRVKEIIDVLTAAGLL